MLFVFLPVIRILNRYQSPGQTWKSKFPKNNIENCIGKLVLNLPLHTLMLCSL